MKFGLIGYNIAYSLSPVIHKMIWHGELDYGILDISSEDLKDKLFDMVRGYSGFNVTIPHKQAIMTLCNDIDPQAQKIGAVNTVAINNGIWKGYNTDYLGFMETMKSDIPDFLSYHPVIVGYGGVARAVIFALEKLGFTACSVLGGAVDSERKEFVVGMKDLLDLTILDIAPGVQKIWINCTPVGGAKIKDVPDDYIPYQGKDILLDLNYTPYPTYLEIDAARKGVKTINGIKMLVYQAIEAEKIWNGNKIPACDANLIIDTIVQRKDVS